jgi:hypothetical protein
MKRLMKRRKQGRLLPALLAVGVMLVLLWFLCQFTFGTITVSVPFPQPTHVMHYHKSK